MTTMVVLVRLKEGVEPQDYERWVLEGYAPAVGELSSVSDWRNHRVTGLLGTGERPPYDYVVTLEVADLARLGGIWVMAGCGRCCRSCTATRR